LALASLCAEITAQGPGRGRRGRGRPPRTAPPPEPEKTEEDKPVENWLAIQGGDVHIGNGSVIRRATVLLGDDKIHGIGHELDIPEGAKTLDATGMVVSPGFCAVKGSSMGAPSGTPQGKFADEVNPFDSSIKRGLAAGVTSFLVQASPGRDSIGGRTAVIKLAYGDLEGMVCEEGSVFSISVPLSPAKLREFRKLVEKAQDHREKLEELGPDEKKPEAPRGTENILAVMEGKARLWISSGRGYSVENIRKAMEISDLLGVGVVLDNPTAAWVIPDEIATTGSMAIINPRERRPSEPGNEDQTGSNIATASILGEAGVPVAVTPPAGRFGGASPGTGGIMGADLNTPHIDAAYAVRGGMDNRKALRTITLDAARIMGVEDRVGSIEVGKDADLLILDGDPLHYKTFVQVAIVNGKIVYEKDKEPFYSHIKR
jgi:hypothetical protein